MPMGAIVPRARLSECRVTRRVTRRVPRLPSPVPRTFLHACFMPAGNYAAFFFFFFETLASFFLRVV